MGVRGRYRSPGRRRSFRLQANDRAEDREVSECWCQHRVDDIGRDQELEAGSKEGVTGLKKGSVLRADPFLSRTTARVNKGVRT